ncbi:MAG TPA: hypothetical protein VM598_10025 [Bdellovibrionota bacterium]|nr:hypothetical protein [Bdellovibrionota bacterium]
MAITLMDRSRLFLAAGVLLTAQWALNMELKTLEGAWLEPPQERDSHWNPVLFKALSFGQVAASVDWLWMKVLQDPSMIKVTRGTHAGIFYDLDLATDLDPAYLDAYTSGANLLAVIRDDIEGARHLLLKAERFRKEELPKYSEFFQKTFWQGAWYPAFILAYIHIFEMQDIPGGAAAFEEAARIPGVPDFVPRLTERFKKRGGHYEVGIKLIGFMIESTKQDEFKAEMTRKRDSMIVGQYVFQINDEFSFFLRAQPGYREQQSVPVQKLKVYWDRFRQQKNLPARDPWGGALSISPEGRVVTSTRYERVFGLE